MSVSKIIIATLILVLGLTGAYLIISKEEKTTSTSSLVIEENNPVGIEVVNTNTSKNLTNILTQKIEENIAKENTAGFRVLDGETLINAPKPEQMVEDLILEAQKNFNPESLRPKVNDADLKISENDNNESFIKYFESFNKILIEASENIPMTLFDENKMDISDFLETKEVYEQTSNNFYDLTVPRPILNIHKKEIELLLTKKNIYEKMANADEDPMTAFLAVDELLKIDLEFATLKIDIGKFLKTIQN